MLRRCLIIASTILGGGAMLLTAGPAQAATSSYPAAGKVSTTLRQNVNLQWSKGRLAGRDRESFTIPGVGRGEIVCRRDATYIRMYPNRVGDETQMWNVKYERKGDTLTPAIRNARVYRYSHPLSTQKRGTGRSASEGFNQYKGIESESEGNMIGLISRRAARNADPGYAVPPTSFRLEWKWAKMHDWYNGSCEVKATFVTQVSQKTLSRALRAGRGQQGPLAASSAVNWHGRRGGEASGPTSAGAAGVMRTRCGRDGSAYVEIQSPGGRGLSGDVVLYEGEGPDAAIAQQLAYDPATGFATLDLPVNGMLHAYLKVDGQYAGELIASSERKTNDPDPAAGYCETAVQYTQPG